MLLCDRTIGFGHLLLGVACAGCYAGLGPTLGTVNGSATLGWEASAATVTVGQSFATKSEDTLARSAKRYDYAFARRTYLLWEPRFGTAPRADRDDAFSFGGGGVSVGMRWDRVAGATGDARSHFGSLGGAFIGGGHVFDYGASRCDMSFQPYVSVAIGFRGKEIYLAPKGGVVGVPHICITLTSFGGW